MKKVLSWVLVLALVLGSFATSFAGDTASSKDFKDAAKIQCVEAVDVMVATGVINGYPDGTFQPEKTVTRAEMAKMIATIKNGGEDIGDTYAGSCTFADSVNHWAAGYIGYCAAKGIIAGRSADVFDPDATVTGTEAAKMALVALGYKAEAEGLTGADWAANTLDLAKENDLFDGCTADFKAGNDLSRDNAAQILFNALNANIVKYNNTTTVTIGGAEVVIGGEAEPTDNTLADKVFDGDLVSEEDTRNTVDPFGAPSITWTYDGDKIGTYAQDADYEFIAEKTGLMKAVDAYDEDLAKDMAAGHIGDNYVNGDVVATGSATDKVDLGDKVAIYENDYNGTTYYRVVIKHYDAYKIVDVDTDVKDSDAEDGVTAYVEIEGLDTYNDDEIAGYDADTYVKDAVIQAAVNNKGEILDSFISETVSGTVTKTYETAYAVDGTKYDKALHCVKLDGKDVKAGNDYDLYLINGYVNASALIEDKSEVYYGLVLDFGTETSNFNKDKDKTLVKMLTADGEEVVYTLNVKYNVPESAVTEKVAVYTLNEDGEIDSIIASNRSADPNKANYTFGSFPNQKMKTGGVLYNKVVAEDVVAFAKDGDDWVIYDYSDIESADEFSASYILNSDKEMKALKLDGNLEESNEVLAIITDVVEGTNEDGVEYEITAYVDGKEETYLSVADMEADYESHLVVMTFDADNKVKAVRDANVKEVSDLVDSFGKDENGNAYDVAGLHATVKSKDGNLIDIGLSDDVNKQNIAGATVYYFNDDNELEIGTTAKVKKESKVVLIQTDEDASTWNIVIIVPNNDYLVYHKNIKKGL